MQKKEKLFFNFFLFLGLAILIFGLFKTVFSSSIKSWLESFFISIEKTVLSTGSRLSTNRKLSTFQTLEEENKTLLQQLSDLQALQKEVNALRDQFQTALPRSQTLLPARIVGAPAFIPGFSLPETLIIDKGKKDSVAVGQAVVVKNNLVGRVAEVSESLARIDLVWNINFLITAKTARRDALGVMKGKRNGEMIFDNIFLADDIKVSDLVVTRGDLDSQGQGVFPGIIIGEIVSVEKKPSALFQTAKIKSLISFQKLSIVFVKIKSE